MRRISTLLAVMTLSGCAHYPGPRDSLVTYQGTNIAWVSEKGKLNYIKPANSDTMVLVVLKISNELNGRLEALERKSAAPVVPLPVVGSAALTTKPVVEAAKAEVKTPANPPVLEKGP